MATPITKASILIVDDEPSLCNTLKVFFHRQGFQTATSHNVDEALDHLEQEHVDLVLTDMCMPGRDGMDLLKEINGKGGSQAVVVMTAFASISQTVEAMRWGASDYIAKPFKLQDLATIVGQALSRRRLNGDSNTSDTIRASRGLAQGWSSSPDLVDRCRMPLVGNSPVMSKLLSMIERVSATDSSVLIVGATGTGKELVACQIHQQSQRRNEPLVDINCSAIPDTLIEAELFGHERGTFTGATETRPGLFEEASGGTLLLDEIDALNLAAQAKLLRVLQERHVRRVGGRKNIPVDVRIIAATNKDIHQAVANGTFRHDLMYRLCVVPIHVPELCEREEDVPLLIEFFLQRHASRLGTKPKTVTSEAMQILLKYRWPGNVRELENAIEYAQVVSQGRQIGPDDLPQTVRARQYAARQIPDVLKECAKENAPLAEVERRYVQLMLERHDGHHINTAAALGIDRRTLSRKLQQYGSRILKREENGSDAFPSGLRY